MVSGLLKPEVAKVRAPLRSPLGAVPGLSLVSLLVSTPGWGLGAGLRSFLPDEMALDHVAVPTPRPGSQAA